MHACGVAADYKPLVFLYPKQKLSDKTVKIINCSTIIEAGDIIVVIISCYSR